jgi:hypothetical protein
MLPDDSVTLLPLVSRVPPLEPSVIVWFEMSAVLPVAQSRPPPFSVTPPVPRLLLVLKLRYPALTVVPPV